MRDGALGAWQSNSRQDPKRSGGEGGVDPPCDTQSAHEAPRHETDIHRIERKQAEAHAEQLRAAAGADLDQLATKDDLEKAVTRLEGSHALLKWMVGFTLAFVVAIAWRVFV